MKYQVQVASSKNTSSMRDTDAALRCRSLGSYEGKKFDWADGFILLALHGLLTNHHNWLTLFSLFSAKDDKLIPTYRRRMEFQWPSQPSWFDCCIPVSSMTDGWWAFLCLNIAFRMSQDLTNEFPNLVRYVYYWTFVECKKGWRAIQYENHGNTWKATQLCWNCANIYKLVRQYFAPCLFNQEAVVVIFQTNTYLSSKTAQKISFSFQRKS